MILLKESKEKKEFKLRDYFDFLFKINLSNN
jgi:hypothetical protein